MTGVTLLIITYVIVAIILIAIVLNFIQKGRIKDFEKTIANLEKEKNLIISTPVLSELTKVESIIKNEKMEERYKNWQRRFEIIKADQITKITDMIIDLDVLKGNKNYDETNLKIAKTEIELYKAKNAVDHLLGEIKEITLSEEKYRTITTKLKSKYRELMNEFQKHIDDYGDIKTAIELQFENIEKRFSDFELAMEANEYNDVVHVVKALDTMIDHMAIVVDEVPNLVLLANELIPRRILEIQDIYKTMTDEGYPLEYLKIEYNMEELSKNISSIIDRMKVLNLEDCMFELKTMLDYLDSLFNDFEKERLSKRVYEDSSHAFDKKLKRINKIVSDIYKQIDDIKNMYDLTNKDIKIIDDVNDRLLEINISFKDLKGRDKAKDTPYSKLNKDIEFLTVSLKELEEDLDKSLKSLGSMYDDEVRAREQLNEIQELLKQCKERIRSYKLPIVINNYFVQLSEANEAIFEIIKELEKKPIVIKVLNTRVDTARDLVLKLYNTTNEMIKTAQLAEMAIVYGNRYRSNLEEVDLGLNNAEKMFFKGDYKNALQLSINTINLVEPGIHKKLLDIYSKEK